MAFGSFAQLVEVVSAHGGLNDMMCMLYAVAGSELSSEVNSGLKRLVRKLAKSRRKARRAAGKAGVVFDEAGADQEREAAVREWMRSSGHTLIFNLERIPDCLWVSARIAGVCARMHPQATRDACSRALDTLSRRPCSHVWQCSLTSLGCCWRVRLQL